VRRVSADQAFVLVAGEAEKGNPDAMLTLGGMYEQGIGIGRNFGKAREWYQKAAAAGLATGRYNVGVCWELGMGSEVNLEKALEEYQKAADMGLAQAMFKIFTLLSTSDDSPKDEQRSFDLGLPQAMFKLFAQPSTGGISKDKSRAFANLQKAADAGHADAAGLLGVTLLNGLSGQEKNQAKALTYLAIAAQAGNLEAMKNLGVVFKDGLGTNVSLVTALKWYLIALKGGYPAEAIQPIIDELRAQTGEAQAAKVEKDADDWIAAFKARQGGS
jgi:TPR repeat protein